MLHPNWCLILFLMIEGNLIAMEQTVLNPSHANPGQVESKMGYTNAEGKFVIPPRFEEAERFSEGLAAVKVDKQWCFINEKGEIVIQTQFTENLPPGPFSDGLAIINERRNRKAEFKGTHYFIQPDTLYGYIDRTGKMIAKPKFSFAREFRQGIAVVKEGEGFRVNLAQATGNALNRLAPVIGGSKMGKHVDGKWGMIDRQGNYIVKPTFDGPFSFHGDVALVEKEGQFGFLLRSGEYLLKPQFEDAKDFIETSGLAPVKKKGKWGYVNRQGRFMVEPKYDRLLRDGADRWEWVMGDEVHTLNDKGELIGSARPITTWEKAGMAPPPAPPTRGKAQTPGRTDLTPPPLPPIPPFKK